MPAKRILPSDAQLKRWVDQGMTHQEIADRVSRIEGVSVGRTAVAAALSRAGLTERRRYTETIPWEPVKMEHQTQHHLWMLRIAHRVKYNIGVVPEEQRKRFLSWKRNLDERNMVITYEPDTDYGFYTTPREPGDEELIRPPKIKAEAVTPT